MPTITAANTVLTIAIDQLYATPVQIQGYSADDVTDMESQVVAETMMGVDGLLSGGMVFVPWVQSIVLQADSPSIAIFDTWYAAQLQIRDSYIATGLILYPSIGLKYPLTKGFLTTYKPLSQAKKVLQPRTFGITWQVGVPTPI